MILSITRLFYKNTNKKNISLQKLKKEKNMLKNTISLHFFRIY